MCVFRKHAPIHWGLAREAAALNVVRAACPRLGFTVRGDAAGVALLRAARAVVAVDAAAGGATPLVPMATKPLRFNTFRMASRVWALSWQIIRKAV